MPKVQGQLKHSTNFAELVVADCPGITGPLPLEWSDPEALRNLVRLDLANVANVSEPFGFWIHFATQVTPKLDHLRLSGNVLEPSSLNGIA